MSDLGSEIFKRYGLSVILAVFLGACGIWAFAHWTAAPGREVSVLWGLVKYTKQVSGPEDEVSVAAHEISSADGQVTPGSPTASSSDTSLDEVTLTVNHGVSPANCDMVLSNLRSQRGLREITAAESGKQIDELPIGTYCFLFSAYIRVTPPYQNAVREIGRGVAGRYRTYPSYFEIQKTGDGQMHLIVFLNELQAAEITSLSGRIEHTVVASPYPSAQMQSLVSIPVDRVLSSRVRELQVSKQYEMVVTDLTVK